MKKILIIMIVSGLYLTGCSQSDNTTETQPDQPIDSQEVTGTDAGAGELEDEVENEDKETTTQAEPLPATTLQKNDQNEEVTRLQEALRATGYDVEITGVFDDVTVWAITDIQLQIDALEASGIYDTNMHDILEDLADETIAVTPENGLARPAEPNVLTKEVENPYDVLAVINKEFSLPADYMPEDLVVPDVAFPFEEDDPKKQLRKEAAGALEDLFAAAAEDNLHIFAQSGFRSFDRQEQLFTAYAAEHGEEKANTYSARPGESEHQTGLVMDVTAQAVGFTLTTDFGETTEGKWLQEYAHEYGFIIRYPLGKEDITKYQYEPWHLRYVGKRAAKEIAKDNLTLEEYLLDN